MKVDFNKLKEEISLPDLFLYLGWKFAPGSSNSAVKMTNGSHTYVIKRNTLGQYTYWDVHGDSRGKSCLDFMQQHIYEQTGKTPSLREAGEALQTFLDNHDILTVNNSNIKVVSSNLDDSQLAALGHELKPYAGDFLQKRNISEATLSSPVFKDVFYSRLYKVKGKEYNNTCIKIINEKGFQGISQRGFDENGKSFKGFKGYKYGSLGITNHNKSRPIDLICVGESMIDNASHYQIKFSNTQKNLLYISTEGSITQGQIELISLLLVRQNITDYQNKVLYIFDNDREGHKYAVKLDTYLREQKIPEIDNFSTEELKDLVSRIPNTDLSILCDWNDDLQAGILSSKDRDFATAVLNNDYNKLIELHTEGYIPSLNMLSKLECDAKTHIAVESIFNLAPKENIPIADMIINVPETSSKEERKDITL